MQLSVLTTLLTCASSASAAISWALVKSSNPTADQADAYKRIEGVMQAAAARHSRMGIASKVIRVHYAPGVPTADANYGGDIRFGSNRSYMTERTALHEIAHTLGVGQTQAFNDKCARNDWPKATAMLRLFDGPTAKINCGGSHIWPYGLNYDNEWSEINANRHVRIINAMLLDGM